MKKEVSLISTRLKLQPCPMGKHGFCCKNCLMGPCRVTNKNIKGVCGASQDLIVARNILRFIAGGASAHCGHAYHLLNHLNQSYPQNYIRIKALDYLYKLWDKLGIIPKIKFEHFKDISEALHLSTLGVNSDYQDVLTWCMKIGIIDGYYGLYLATELEDKKFGKPNIKKSELNLSCIDPKKVNIAVHGHEPMLAEAIAKEAIKHKDINLVGVCCTGASLLSRHGIPLAAHFMLQENVIVTGLIEVMVVDIQCVMPSLSDLCECYHTKLITTNEIGRIPNSLHLPIKNEIESKNIAKKIIQIAKQNKKNRINKKNLITKKPNHVVIGFTEDNINIKNLANQIKNKKIKGVIGVVGCVNPRTNVETWINIFKNLSKDYIILTTGCIAFEFGRNNLLDGKRFFHLGSCVNNSRIAEIFKRISNSLNKQITELPFLISCPAPITEKSIAIGFFFASLGVDVHFGYPFLISSDTNVSNFLENTLKKHFKSKIFLDTNQISFYNKIKNGLTIIPQE
ncbi:MAG: hypothetical protein ISS82_04020 [Nanoarchaeota archaeon]|nr:hypothetical protein [Nanoarchaeota archaeon]